MNTSTKQTENLAECGNKSKPLCVPCMSRTHSVSSNKNSKIQISNYKSNLWSVIFPEGASPLWAD